MLVPEALFSTESSQTHMAGSLLTATRRSSKGARPWSRNSWTCLSIRAALLTLCHPVAKRLCQNSARRSWKAWGLYCIRQAQSAWAVFRLLRQAWSPVTRKGWGAGTAGTSTLVASAVLRPTRGSRTTSAVASSAMKVVRSWSGPVPSTQASMAVPGDSPYRRCAGAGAVLLGQT